jgi:hypothetical protein
MLEDKSGRFKVMSPRDVMLMAQEKQKEQRGFTKDEQEDLHEILKEVFKKMSELVVYDVQKFLKEGTELKAGLIYYSTMNVVDLVKTALSMKPIVAELISLANEKLKEVKEKEVEGKDESKGSETD